MLKSTIELFSTCSFNLLLTFLGSFQGKLETTARHLMEKGYQQQLTYKLVNNTKINFPVFKATNLPFINDVMSEGGGFVIV